MSDRIIPTYDSEGNLSGLFDFGALLDASAEATKTAIANLDAERPEIVIGIMRAVKALKPEDQAVMLAGTIADLLETFRGPVDVCEAYGVPVRSKLREIWGIGGEGQ